jgi:hypothetical protein
MSLFPSRMYVSRSASHQSLRTTRWSARVDRHVIAHNQLEPLRPVTTHGEPEFGRVIDEGLWMAHYQLVVAGRRVHAPLLGLQGLPGIAEDACEAGRVLGGVAGCRQRTQAVDGGVPGTQGRVDLGEVTQRRSVGRHPLQGGVEPGTGRVEVALAEPHQAAPEVERGYRERRDTPVAAPRLGEQALRLGDFPALSLEHGQRTQRREVGSALRCGPA